MWLDLWSMIMRMENVVFDQGSFVSPACFLSSEHFALASTSVSMQGRLFSLCSVLCFVLSPQAQALRILCCLWRSLSSQAVSYSISPLSVKGLDHASLLSTQLSDFFPSVWNIFFYWLWLQTFAVFWRVHKSKRLAPASFPLGAEEEGTS